jgi:hypothetical protein
MWEAVPPDEHATVREVLARSFSTLRDPDGRARLQQEVRYTVGTRFPV